ncbi:MAG TPA: DUF4426 domain-containing protein [Wenzhouxiangella sp.]
MNRTFIKAWIIAIALLMGNASWAEQASRFGNYIAHYNTFNTTFLTPDVARAYGITRSGNLALLNIAVLKVNDEGLNEPVRARVQVRGNNLAGQRKSIEMTEIEDGGAIYYIGTFRIRNEERINFTVNITPINGVTRSHELRFNQIFYVEQ